MPFGTHCDACGLEDPGFIFKCPKCGRELCGECYDAPTCLECGQSLYPEYEEATCFNCWQELETYKERAHAIQ
jgi:hypothetical protein